MASVLPYHFFVFLFITTFAAWPTTSFSSFITIALILSSSLIGILRKKMQPLPPKISASSRNHSKRGGSSSFCLCGKRHGLPPRSKCAKFLTPWRLQECLAGGRPAGNHRRRGGGKF
ncbi:hypothetical protein IWX92DRAFT_378870 [Phyllosticta citricarpa]